MSAECPEDILDVIQKLFLSCSDLKVLDLKNIVLYIKGDKDSLQAQRKLLQATALNPLNLQYPVKKEYQRLFLKKLISELQACGEDISDSLYDCFGDKFVDSEQVFFYCHYQLGNQTYITIQQSSCLVIEGTTGLSTWEGGLALSEWCLQHSSTFTGKRVLELGCGVGLTGLTVSVLCQPLSYTFTDCHHRVLSVLDHNLKLNAAQLGNTVVSSRLLDWQDCRSWRPYSHEVDIVLAADVVFDERLFKGLANTIHYYLCANSAVAILALTERDPKTISTFYFYLECKNIKVQELQCPLPSTFHFSLRPPIRIFSCSYGQEDRPRTGEQYYITRSGRIVRFPRR